MLANYNSDAFVFFLQKKATGQQLMEQVYYHLDLIEKDYFGLQYMDAYNVPHWLDPTKLVKKQVKSKYLPCRRECWVCKTALKRRS